MTHRLYLRQNKADHLLHLDAAAFEAITAAGRTITSYRGTPVVELTSVVGQ